MYILNNKVLCFSAFLNNLSESNSYSIPGVNLNSDGMYRIEVSEIDAEKENSDPNGIFISVDSNNVSLFFIDGRGKKSEEILIPKESLEIVDEDPNKKYINFLPYGSWISKSQNLDMIEDFIEDYGDSIESDRNSGPDRDVQNAKDDVEIMLDIFDVTNPIKKFNKISDDLWNAELEDGRIVEIFKKNPDDLMSVFKIFKTKDHSKPVLTIKKTDSAPKTIFNLDGLDKVEIGDILLGYRNQNPYIRYLAKKSLGSETSEDQSDLYNYFLEKNKKENKDHQELRNIIKLLSDFVNPEELNSISLTF